jgi:hypothetical protein
LTDTLPDPGSVSFVSATPPCGEAGGIVTCALNPMAPNETVVLEIEVTPMDSGIFLNTASVSGIEADPVPANNSDMVDTSVTGISVFPASHFFGYIPVGGMSSLRTFTVSNVSSGGTPDLTVTSVTLGGGAPADFQIQTDTCSSPPNPPVSPGGNCTVEALFAPGSAGMKNALLMIDSSDPVVPVVNVPLSGTQIQTLTVIKSGTGGGTVTSLPAGISCGSTCLTSFPYGTEVLLSSVPQPGSEFSGWSGDPDCADGSITITGDITCTATFDLIFLTLSAVPAGTGTGSVSSAPPGIVCGSDCTEDYVYGTPVDLTAAPGPDSVFVRWTGDCSGSLLTASVSMTVDRSCAAIFNLITYSLEVEIQGPGKGSVSSSPAGIQCETDCSEDFETGTEVILSPTAQDGSRFIGWGGNGDCSDGSVTLDADKTCTAAFADFGDLDGSGRVDGFDLGRLGMAYESTPADDRWNPQADLNGDLSVDDSDVDILLSSFGNEK